MGNILEIFIQTFYYKKLELVLVGLENSGKSTLLNVLMDGAAIQTVPTIGVNVKSFKKGGIQMNCWDLGGQSKYRSDWANYVVGTQVIIFVVDAFASHRLPEAKAELHRLLELKGLATTPILIIANKIDLHPHVSEKELIKELNLDYIVDNPWILISCSALKNVNIHLIIQYLLDHAK